MRPSLGLSAKQSLRITISLLLQDCSIHDLPQKSGKVEIIDFIFIHVTKWSPSLKHEDIK